MSDAIPGPEPRWLRRGGDRGEFVATLCTGDCGGGAPARFRRLAREAGLDIVREHRPAANVTQLDLDGAAAAAWSLYLEARATIADADFHLRPRGEQPRRLLICDMDMTIVAAETLDEVAAALGMGERIAQITARAMHGELDFDAALRERIAMLAGRPERAFHEVARRLELNPGARELVAGASAAGVHTILISGGFGQVAGPVAAMLGFDEVHSNRLELEDGRLSGRVVEPIINAALKRRTLEQRAAALGIALEHCCAIGDGANDRPMIEAAGLGIAYRGKPVLRAAASCQINATGLDSALWFMGIGGAA